MSEIAKKKKKTSKKVKPIEPMDKEKINNISLKEQIKSNNSLKEKLTKKECKCQPFPQWAKWMVVILIIAIFIIVCVQLHYLWKLSDIWQAIKNTK